MKKLTVTKTLTIAAMLTAVGIVLGFYKIPINQFIEVRFASIPISLAGLLFGPAVGGVVGALVDIGGYIAKPTGPFFPGFTVSSALTGIVFGFFFYRKKPTALRIAIAEVFYTVLIGILLNSYWLNILYFHDGFTATVITRLPKELIMLPINGMIRFILFQALAKANLLAVED